MSFHRKYRALVDKIERDFPVSQWRNGDVDIWPLARMGLYLDMRWEEGEPSIQKPSPLPRRIASHLLRPILNLWRSRKDLSHWTGWPQRADAVFLGDGVSLDLVDGAWRDSFAEPLAAALEARGEKLFLMQRGGFERLPWHRATFAANVADAWGWLLSWTVPRDAHLPRHEDVMRLLAAQGVKASSLCRDKLVAQAVIVAAGAIIFEAILRLVKPRRAFIVNYFAGSGPAFVLACRRRNIPCIDLQRAPQEVCSMAYGLLTPPSGYSVLPNLFWTWNERDAEKTSGWAAPYHGAFHGGDLRLANAPGDTRLRSRFEREILVALQPIGGYRNVWETLAKQIVASPPNWRWWIRRHPASSPAQDIEFGSLLSLNGPNVKIAEASAPLMTLLPDMDVLLSLESGTAVEASIFGLHTIFLSKNALDVFPELIAGCAARIIAADGVNAAIAQLPSRKSGGRPVSPDLNEVLSRLEDFMTKNARSHPTSITA